MPPTEDALTAWDIIRYAWSTVAVLGSLGIIFYGISIGMYVLPTPPGATFVIFFLAMSLLFYLEGLMISIVAIKYWDRYIENLLGPFKIFRISYSIIMITQGVFQGFLPSCLYASRARN